MNRRFCAALGGVLLSLVLTSVASAAPTPGSRSLGDPLLPLLGNGGYDVQHYDLTIDYDPAANSMTSSRRSREATQDLSEFSLDFRGLTVTSSPSTAPRPRSRATADKLVITPATAIDNGARSRPSSPTTACRSGSRTPTSRSRAGCGPATARSWSTSRWAR